jgi:hypothetical protein
MRRDLLVETNEEGETQRLASDEYSVLEKLGM